MVVVETINVRDTQILHRLLLDERDPLLPLLNAGGTGARSIEDRSHLPLGDQRVEHRLVKLPYSLGFTFIDIHREVAQLVDNLLIRHLQYGLRLRCRTSILLEHGANLLTIHLSVFNHHLTHHVEVQFEHLSDLLVEGHLLEGLLYLCLQRCVTRNGGFLGLYTYRCADQHHCQYSFSHR